MKQRHLTNRCLRSLRRAAWLVVMLPMAPAIAQEANETEAAADALDLTMTLLPEGATTPDAVTRTIELPDPAALRAAPPGLERADEARTGREAGLANAAEARERGRQMSEQAQEQRENTGRAGDRPGGPPGERPDPGSDRPGPPDDRGPPGN